MVSLGWQGQFQEIGHKSWLRQGIKSKGNLLEVLEVSKYSSKEGNLWIINIIYGTLLRIQAHLPPTLILSTVFFVFHRDEEIEVESLSLFARSSNYSIETTVQTKNVFLVSALDNQAKNYGNREVCVLEIVILIISFQGLLEQKGLMHANL